MATEWFCRIMGDEWGPMSAQELVAVARYGRLTRDDVVRRGATGTWVRAEIVEGLMNTPAPAPTVTSRRVAIARQQATPAKRSVAKARPAKHQPPTHAAPTHAAADQYWIHNGKKKAGPFSGQKLRQLAAAGALRRDDLVRSNRSGWVRATRVKGLEFGDLSPLTQTVVSRPAARPHERSSSPPHASNGHTMGNAHVDFGCIEFANRVLCEAS
ncbi:MAG: GYF domain-containing protein [Pirellulales bacterium]